MEDTTHTFGPELNLDALRGKYNDLGYISICDTLSNGRAGPQVSKVDAEPELLRACLYLTAEQPTEDDLIIALRTACEVEMRLLTTQGLRRFTVCAIRAKGERQIFQRVVVCMPFSTGGNAFDAFDQSTADPVGIAAADAAGAPGGVIAVHSALRHAIDGVGAASAMTAGMWGNIIAQKDTQLAQKDIQIKSLFDQNHALVRELEIARTKEREARSELAELDETGAWGVRRKPAASDSLERAGSMLKEALGALAGMFAGHLKDLPKEVIDAINPDLIKHLNDPNKKAAIIDFLKQMTQEPPK
mgnify:CR=1 FL=1